MKDPERLSRHPSSRLSLLLLEAGADERPSPRARARTLQAVALAAGAGAGAATASASAAATKLTATSAASAVATGTAMTGGSVAPIGATIGLGVIAKWFGIGALAGVLAAPVVRAVVEARPSARTAPLPSPATVGRASDLSTRPVVARPKAPELVASTRADERGAENTAALHAPQKPDLVRSAARSEPPGRDDGTSTPMAPAAADGPLLAVEVKFVELGRAALQRGAFAEALTLLAPYESRFPKQQLLTEVLFLRMEAFSRSGDAPRARSLAARIVRRDVAGPQAARAREVLGP